MATSPRADKHAEKLDHLYVAGENIKWHSHSGKQFGRVSSSGHATWLLGSYLGPQLGIEPESPALTA